MTTDDIHTTYREFLTRGVEFVDEPTKQPYGIETSFRDPSGNHIRPAQQG